MVGGEDGIFAGRMMVFGAVKQRAAEFIRLLYGGARVAKKGDAKLTEKRRMARNKLPESPDSMYNYGRNPAKSEENGQ